VEQGLITPEEVRAFADLDQDTQFYICGPGPFMDVVEGTLRSSGVEAARIHIERFTPADPLPDERVPPFAALTSTQVTIELNGRTESTEHHPGTTILQTARQMGMSPPYSCEMGSCATCMAMVTEGSVVMHVNNALTADEIEEGWVLTCQSVPTSPTIHVVYE